MPYQSGVIDVEDCIEMRVFAIVSVIIYVTRYIHYICYVESGLNSISVAALLDSCCIVGIHSVFVLYFRIMLYLNIENTNLIHGPYGCRRDLTWEISCGENCEVDFWRLRTAYKFPMNFNLDITWSHFFFLFYRAVP